MRVILFVALLVLAAASGANAGDIADGNRLAQRWCTQCHVIGNSGVHGQDAAPALPPAAAGERNPEWLRTWLTDPHPPMPDLHLTRLEIDDLVTYLASLPRK